MTHNPGYAELSNLPVFGPEALPQPQRVWRDIMPDGPVVEIADYGPMRDLFGAGRSQEVRERVWSGKLSFADRCETDPALRDDMLASTGQLNHYYTQADPTAATRCVDSRPSAASRLPGFFEGKRQL